MTAVRTLPIRVAPLTGEALDSWLEAIAHRTHTAFGDLLSAIALTRHNGVGTTHRWMVRLHPDQVAAISDATGITEATVHAMTLAHYGGRALRIDPDSGTVSRAFPWGRGIGSRFCPTCLAQSGGRWQLAWRLGWTFACTRHDCLLADACPRCGAVQRRRTHVGDVIPTPGRCAHPATDAIGRMPARCGADLTAAPVACFDPNHPVVAAQRIVDAILDAETSAFGVYRMTPQPRLAVLADLRAIAGRALAYATPQDLEAIMPADVLTAYRDAAMHADLRSGPARTDAKPGLAAPARAPTAAVGVAAALQALGSRDVASAGDRLRWLVASSRQRGLAVSATNMGWGKRTSPVLTAVQLAALGPMLKPITQLRYRIGTALPTRPAPDTTAATALAARIPSMLWPAWSLRLSIPNCHQRQLRPILSIALLLINSRLELDAAARLLDSPIAGHAVSRVLPYLHARDEWPSILAGLIRMADYIAEHDVPIDYQRRRRLDYSTLLLDKAWARICRDTATPGPGSIRARIARCFLFERLSGMPASSAPRALDDNAFRTLVADFPRHLTPELARALDEHAHDVLADHGLDGEPVVWRPPASVLDGLWLPGDDPDAVDLTGLHHVVAAGGKKLGIAATRLATSLDTVRYLLETHPAPRPARPPGAAPTRGAAYCTAKAALPRARFVELYEHQGMALRDVAATVGASRHTITRLAHDYDIPLRDPVHRARITIDRDWLHERYVTGRRSLPDIADEAGMSTANMARWAKTHAIPLRGRGGPSHSASLNAQRGADQAPELIRPALAGIGGWERLQRFAAASPHPTLTVAAKELGVHQFTLVNQINRIERELGSTLLVRAERGRSMTLTDHGTRVVAAIRACQRQR
jgi:TniQ/Bacterial regulatory helix-turn-helix protein, lysR family